MGSKCVKRMPVSTGVLFVAAMLEMVELAGTSADRVYASSWENLHKSPFLQPRAVLKNLHMMRRSFFFLLFGGGGGGGGGVTVTVWGT